MPTGYTTILLDKPETSFREFAMLCARAFGALITMRDEPLGAQIPDEFKPDTYYLDAMKGAEVRVRELEVMTLDVATKEAERAYGDGMKAHIEAEARTAAENAAYASMLRKVEAWEPPPECADMKAFMREQLTISMVAPLGDRWKPKRRDAAEWLADERTEAARGVKHNAGQWKEECERAAKRTAWLRALRSSLVQS